MVGWAGFEFFRLAKGVELGWLTKWPTRGEPGRVRPDGPF